jgi:hypothetical protein
MKRSSSSISDIEERLKTLRSKKQKLIADHEEILKPVEDDILKTSKDLTDAKRQQDNSHIQNIRTTPALWDKFCDDYFSYDYMENYSYLGFKPEDSEDVNRYYHLTLSELEAIVDFCIEHGGQYQTNKRQIWGSFRFTYSENSYRYTEMYDKIKPLKVDRICTTAGTASGKGFFNIYLHRQGPPLDRHHIERFRLMVKQYQPLIQ